MNRIAVLLIFALPLLTSGCMWGRMKINDPEIVRLARNIEPGKTLGSDVPRILGAQPTMRMPGKEYRMLGYTYADTKSNGLMLILFNFTRSSTVAETLYIEVDSKTDVVTRMYIPPTHDLEWRFWPFGD